MNEKNVSIIKVLTVLRLYFINFKKSSFLQRKDTKID